MADYSQFCIVAEEQRVCVRKPLVHQERACCGRCWRSGRDTVKDIVLSFGEWEFTIKSEGPHISAIGIKNTNANNPPNNPPMVAEIVVWQWDDQNSDNNHHQKVIEKFLYTKNQSLCLVSSSLQSDVHFIIRILGRRKPAQDVCRPLNSLGSDAFTISVGDQKFVVSAQRLKQVSPIFSRIIELKVREKAERKLEVDDTEPEQFRAFLEVIQPQKNVHPNPTNVVGVLKLAHRYQVSLAKQRCVVHLMNCVEMPLIERLQLSQTYWLKKLKESILSIGSVKLRAFYKANLDELKKGQFDADLLDELHWRLCGDE